MAAIFEKLKGLLEDKQYWEEFSHPYVSASNAQYYLNKFVGRVGDLIKKKNIPDKSIDSYIVSMATRKLRIACMNYYDIESYTERDKEDCGRHLLSISESYEYIAQLVGVTPEVVEQIHEHLSREGGKRCVGLPYTFGY